MSLKPLFFFVDFTNKYFNSQTLKIMQLAHGNYANITSETLKSAAETMKKYKFHDFCIKMVLTPITTTVKKLFTALLQLILGNYHLC